MVLDFIREYCLSKSGAEESFPFDEDVLVFKTGGKIFALISVSEPDTINLKCDPAKALELREEFEEVQPGFHMNKKHWNTVSLKGRLKRKQITEMIDHSFELVYHSLPAKKKKRL